jgi:hypothetical protein
MYDNLFFYLVILGATMNRNSKLKHEKFKELAEKRVNRAINELRLIGNLANRNNYIFEQEEASKICSVLESEIKTLRLKFSSDKKDKFKL